MLHHYQTPAIPYGLPALWVAIIPLLTSTAVAEDRQQPPTSPADAIGETVDELDRMTDAATDAVGGPVPNDERHNHGPRN